MSKGQDTPRNTSVRLATAISRPNISPRMTNSESIGATEFSQRTPVCILLKYHLLAKASNRVLFPFVTSLEPSLSDCEIFRSHIISCHKMFCQLLVPVWFFLYFPCRVHRATSDGQGEIFHFEIFQKPNNLANFNKLLI